MSADDPTRWPIDDEVVEALDDALIDDTWWMRGRDARHAVLRDFLARHRLIRVPEGNLVALHIDRAGTRYRIGWPPTHVQGDDSEAPGGAP